MPDGAPNQDHDVAPPPRAPPELVRLSALARGTLGRILTPGGALAALGSLAFIAALGWLALQKYATFHATVEDLGIENQALWLLSHGGISQYDNSGFSSIYPLQAQKPIMFLVLLVYYLDPTPTFLIGLGAVALGGAALPLFLFARRRLHNERHALVVVGAYLLYFPIASATLFDFHYEDLFPLLFFTMCWGWASGRPRLQYIAAALTAAVNPLTLVITAAFLVFTALPPPKTPFDLAWIRRGWSTFWRDPWRVVMLGALVAVFATYAVAGVLFTAGAGAGKSGLPFSGVVFSFANQKLLVIVFLLGSLAFVPFYSLRGMLTFIPYAGFAIYSVNSANFIPFGLMYTLLGTGPLFLAMVDGLAAATPSTAPVPSTIAPPGGGRRRAPISERGSMIRAVAAATLMFALVFFPLSPVNGFVSGGYFAGNHDVANITATTPATEFLDRVIALVPANASVLTQNNIPELSGREHLQIAPAYLAQIPYDAIVMDTEVNYFSSPSTIAPFVNDAFQQDTFGVVAEGQGALYLQRGYDQPAKLYEPFNATYAGTDLTLFSGMQNGSTLVGSGPAYSLWYGPFTTLFPGQYRVDFQLATNTTNATAARALTIDVTQNDGALELTRTDVYPANFTAKDTFQTFSLTFSLDSLATEVEFRGMFPSGVATITLAQLQVIQLSYTP